jgi:glycerol kinase
LASGFWSSVEEIAKTRPEEQVFRPQMDPAKAQHLYARWQDAVGRAKGWNKEMA